ncbi:MAG: pyridoxal phosphate-dependent aminotransferase [Spirochaetes bacterium]|nr:pyridoxal phosphate-dependent aminotransferase [Spirochaetota bacterium]
MKKAMFSDKSAAAGTSSNQLSQLQEKLRLEGKTILNLAQSNPGACGLMPAGILETLTQPEVLQYTPDCRGALNSRQALAAWLGCSVDDLFLSASTSEAYSWLFKLLCNPGDQILVPHPGYPLFEHLAGLENATTRYYRMDYIHPAGWRIDLPELEKQVAEPDVKALVLIHPNNPTGSYIQADERNTIIELCERYKVALIVDEVFRLYKLDEATAPASFADTRSGLCFCLNGLSKLLCLPQLKLGWMQISGAPELTAEAKLRLELIADTYLSVGAAPMHALPLLLPRVADFIAGVRWRLQQNLAAAALIFGGDDSPFRLLRCEGGWTLLLAVPRYSSEEELALRLLEETGILVHPGYFFDCEQEGIFALSLIVPEEQFSLACRKMRQWFEAFPHNF